jgi:hypothetical protein
MKYDDISWHTGAENFPSERPESFAATPSGMFLFWRFQNGLTSERHNTEELKSRSITPSKYFIKACDGKLTNEDFNEQGNNFAHYCYESNPESGYLSVYERTVTSGINRQSNVYDAPDDWTNFSDVCKEIDELYKSFIRSGYKSPQAKFSSSLEKIEECLAKYKYKLSRKNKTATKRIKGYTVRVHFVYQMPSTVYLRAFISSSKIKTWRSQNNRGNSDVIQSFDLCEEFLDDASINLDSSIIPAIEQCIGIGLEGLLCELIESPENIANRILINQSRDRDFNHNFDFLMCYQGLEQAHKYCVSFFQKNIGIFYEYKNIYSYREDYLDKAPSGIAKTLAIISRKFKLGDLSLEVTPE